MNKNAFVFLYICTAGFIIAIFMFYGNVGKQTPGGESLYLGENELEVFTTYQQAEQDLYALELAALLSAKQASKENFQADFEKIFAEYLKRYTLTIEDFTFTYTTKDQTMTIIGKSTKELVYTEEVYIYKIKPSFKVIIPFQTTEETIESSENIFE